MPVVVPAELAALVAEAITAWIPGALLAESVGRRSRVPAYQLRALARQLQTAALTCGSTARGQQPGQPDRWIGTLEAARRLGCTARTVRRRCVSGELVAVRIGSGQWIVDGRTLE